MLTPDVAQQLATLTHRYVITPGGDGCRVVYTQDISRLVGAPWLMRAPGFSRLVFWISARFMRRGFDGLLALAGKRAAGAG
jgi:hypothetical protein